MKPIFCIFFLCSNFLHSRIVDYHLTIDEFTISENGKKSEGLAINSMIPAPTLIFQEGDFARIHVHNRLDRESTSLHWHGLLLPQDQDGVPYLNSPLIQPKQTYVYQFPLTHAGTFWYHSHQQLQEQRGLYGAIIVQPRNKSAVSVDRDYVMVLSDFSHQHPNRIMRNLMRGSNYYSIRKGTAQSIYGAYQRGSLRDFWEREKSRMQPMDVSDVAYDAFWINGKKDCQLPASPGDRIRLRVINAGASTYFYLHSSLPRMSIISADGNEVQPLDISRLLIGMGETYDLLVTIPDKGHYEIRATAQDISGSASLWLGSGKNHPASDVARPNYYNMSFMLSQALDGDAIKQHGSPYQHLKAVKKTKFDEASPVREITLHLTGDMSRYRWSFNNKTIYEESTIRVKRGEVLRIHLINDTMMHHPIHLHGHFFRLINDHDAVSPLKHTVDMPPMGSRTIEFLANEYGDWIFHCHLLYHMDAGMARVISYDDQGLDHQPNLGPASFEPWYFMINGIAQNNMTMGMASIMWGRENFSLDWEHSMHFGDHHDEGHDENQLSWSHYFTTHTSSVAGYRFSLHHRDENRFYAGVRYRFPYFLQSQCTLNDSGQMRFEMSKSLQITDRISAWLIMQYDTNNGAMYGSGVEYTLTENLGISAAYHSDYSWGSGLAFHF